jgi:hypothetical protein
MLRVNPSPAFGSGFSTFWIAEGALAKHHSARRAFMGSIEAARRAGSTEAAKASITYAGVQLSALRLTPRSHPPGLFSAFRGMPGQPRDGPSSSSRLPDDQVKIGGRTSYYENR